MTQDSQTSLQQILATYIPLEHLPYVVQEIKAYYMELVASEVNDFTTSKHLRQKIVRS